MLTRCMWYCAAHRLEVCYSCNVATSGRHRTYTGGDMMCYSCVLSICSRAFAQSVVDCGIPAGKKSTLFNAGHKRRLM